MSRITTSNTTDTILLNLMQILRLGVKLDYVDELGEAAF